ncbi:MAG: maleylpyruvate isomerase N-terminal domain-containing protein [Acidimicrobiales bacterium]
MRPTEVIDVCVTSHHQLLNDVVQLTDNDLREPCRLPGWSRAHVLAHLARNADSHVWLFEGAMIGETRQQYPVEGMRDRDIEAGSTQSKDELFRDLKSSCRALEAAWDELDDNLWESLQNVGPGPRSMAEIVFRRLREVEIHHVDLDVEYFSSDWPELYVEDELRRQLLNLPNRADHTVLVEWLVGRREAPSLGPW